MKKVVVNKIFIAKQLYCTETPFRCFSSASDRLGSDFTPSERDLFTVEDIINNLHCAMLNYNTLLCSALYRLYNYNHKPNNL